MHGHLTKLVVLLAATLPVGLAGQGFEGRVTLEISGGSGRPAQPAVALVKGTMTRFEMSAPGMPGMEMYMILDQASGTVISVMPAQRMYITMDPRTGAGRSPEHTKVPKVVRTGRKATVAGFTCEHVVLDDGGSDKMDVCGATGMGFPGLGGGPGLLGGGGTTFPPGYAEVLKQFKDGFFPLTVDRIRGDSRERLVTVKSIERKALDGGLFEPPAGFQRMEMPQALPR
jgi:hypothetical protein